MTDIQLPEWGPTFVIEGITLHQISPNVAWTHDHREDCPDHEACGINEFHFFLLTAPVETVITGSKILEDNTLYVGTLAADATREAIMAFVTDVEQAQTNIKLWVTLGLRKRLTNPQIFQGIRMIIHGETPDAGGLSISPGAGTVFMPKVNELPA